MLPIRLGESFPNFKMLDKEKLLSHSLDLIKNYVFNKNVLFGFWSFIYYYVK